MRRMIAVLVGLSFVTVSGWTSAVTKVRCASGLSPIPQKTPSSKPHYRVLALACETGVISTTVTNKTKTKVPEEAVITVSGGEAPCSQTAYGPLPPGKSIKLAGCPENVITCGAYAKWERN